MCLTHLADELFGPPGCFFLANFLSPNNMVLPLRNLPNPQRICYSVLTFAHHSITVAIISQSPFTLRFVLPVCFWVNVMKIDIWMATSLGTENCTPHAQFIRQNFSPLIQAVLLCRESIFYVTFPSHSSTNHCNRLLGWVSWGKERKSFWRLSLGIPSYFLIFILWDLGFLLQVTSGPTAT